MAKVRFQMFIDESQKIALDKLHKESRVPMAELVRKAIDRLIIDWKNKKKIPVEDDITKKMLSIAGVCSGGPKDLADNHDKYLYDLSKK